MTPEGKVKVKVDRWVKENLPGAWKYKPRGGPFGNAGVGDYIMVYAMTPVMLEAKADESCDATALQRHQLKLFSQAGGISCLLKGYQEWKLDIIKTLCETRQQILLEAMDNGKNIGYERPTET